MAEKLYRSHSVEKSNNEITGSLTIWQDTPSFPFEIGDTFQPVPNGPTLNVIKVSVNDNVVGELFGKPVRQWQVIIEGSSEEQGSSGADSNITYSFNINSEENSGTMEVVNNGNQPALTLNVGDTFSIPGIGEVICSQVRGNDSYNDKGVHSWTVTYEGSSIFAAQTGNAKYSFDIENNSDGVTVYSGSIETSYSGDTPNIEIKIGDKFSVPYAGELTCTKVKASDEYDNSGTRKWSVICEGSRAGESDSDDGNENLPDDEETISYEINGTTVRSIAGEFIALRKSTTPITKKSLVVYTSSVNSIATPGTTYRGGIVVSESISKESIKSNSVETGSYYKHQIEVEL